MVSRSAIDVCANSHSRRARIGRIATGGLRLLQGRLGRAVIKVSAVPEDRHIVQAPARVFDSQEALLAAFSAGEVNQDMVAVVRFQGPQANGMPELHKLTPPLAVLQNQGFKVALVTDGRMSGASGKVPAAIHVTPEALGGGPLAKVRNGDMVRVDAVVSAAAPVTAKCPGSVRTKYDGAIRRRSVPISEPKAAPPTKVGRKTPVGVGRQSESGESSSSLSTPKRPRRRRSDAGLESAKAADSAAVAPL